MSNIFKVGEKVVSLESASSWRAQPRVKGNTYTVLAIEYCAACGAQAINVSGAVSVECTPNSTCECGHVQPHRGLWWTLSKYFTRPISHEYKLEVAIPELLEIKIPQLQ